MKSSRLVQLCAAVTCVAASALPVGASPADDACVSVQPGAPSFTQREVEEPRPDQSQAFNFLYRGDDGHMYVGLPGVIVLAPDMDYGVYTWRGRSGPDIYDGERKLIGDTVYSALTFDEDPTEFLDFTLVRLRPGVAWDPTICGMSGPTGVDKRKIPQGTSVELSFTGTQLDPVTGPQNGLAFADGMPREYYVSATAATDIQIGYGAVFVSDDSLAVGFLTSDTFTGPDPVGGSDTRHEMGHHLQIVRMTPQIRAAQRALDIRLEMLRGRS